METTANNTLQESDFLEIRFCEDSDGSGCCMFKKRDEGFRIIIAGILCVSQSCTLGFPEYIFQLNLFFFLIFVVGLRDTLTDQLDIMF